MNKIFKETDLVSQYTLLNNSIDVIHVTKSNIVKVYNIFDSIKFVIKKVFMY